MIRILSEVISIPQKFGITEGLINYVLTQITTQIKISKRGREGEGKESIYKTGFSDLPSSSVGCRGNGCPG